MARQKRLRELDCTQTFAHETLLVNLFEFYFGCAEIKLKKCYLEFTLLVWGNQFGETDVRVGEHRQTWKKGGSISAEHV